MLSKRGLEGPSLYCPDIAQAGTFRCFCSVLDSSADASVSECPRAITRIFLARVLKHDTGFESPRPRSADTANGLTVFREPETIAQIPVVWSGNSAVT